jgi:hypothetical protein
MKQFYFLLIFLLAGVVAWSQQKVWNGGNGSWTDASNWTPAGVPGANSQIIFNDGTAGTITGVPTLTITRLRVLNGTEIILRGTGALTINNSVGIDFVVAAGSSLETGVNITLGGPSTGQVAGTFTVNADKTFNTNNGGSVTTVTSTGIFINQGTVTSTNAARFVVQNGGLFRHERNGGVLPTGRWGASSIIEIAGITTTAPAVASFDQIFGNFTWNSTTQTADISLDGNLEAVRGNFSMISTGTGSVTLWENAPGDLLVTGNYIQSGGNLILASADEPTSLELNGNFNMTGGTLGTAGTQSFFTFTRNGLQTFAKSGGTINGEVNFLADRMARVDFGTSVLNGAAANFTLADMATIITAHPDGINSTGATGTIQVGGTRVFNTNAVYEFRGASTGVFTTTNGTRVRDMIINNTTGNVTLSQEMTVGRRLTLTDGELNTTTTNVLRIADNATVAGASDNSFVNGPMIKVGNDAFTFPVGKSGAGLRTIGITPAGGSNATTSFTAEFFRANPQTIGAALGTGVARISSCEYWTLDRTGTNNASVTLSWSAASPCNGGYVSQPASLLVARWDGTAWTDEGNGGTTGSSTAGTVVSDGTVAGFGPFTLASNTLLANPLPVVFDNVRAFEKGDGVQVEWSNMTEKDVASYTVERSANGSDFSGIAQQLPTSNQNDQADYTAFDDAPLAGVNYYRIKAEETTGKIVYSKILSVNHGVTAQRLSLYPNPVKGNQVNISLSNISRGQYDLRVINAAGQDILKQRLNSPGSNMTQTIVLPATIKAGTYHLIITGGEYRETKMFIVQ